MPEFHTLDYADDALADYWLFSGKKYEVSAGLAGDDWKVSAYDALKAYDIDLDDVHDLASVAKVFQPRWKWKPDALFQIWDTVSCPKHLLADGGDDCDGWAMIHAQVAEYVLGKLGWTAYILTMFTDPWDKSHHVAVAVSPAKQHWVLQPEPSNIDPEFANIVAGPYASAKIGRAHV